MVQINWAKSCIKGLLEFKKEDRFDILEVRYSFNKKGRIISRSEENGDNEISALQMKELLRNERSNGLLLLAEKQCLESKIKKQDSEIAELRSKLSCMELENQNLSQNLNMVSFGVQGAS